MQVKPKSNMEQLLPLFMQTGVGIVILLIIWLVITNLPMLKEISFPLRFSLTSLLSAAVLAVMITMLVNFGTRTELRLSCLAPKFPQGGTIVKQFIYLISVLIAYFALKPLLVPYMLNLSWFFHLLFLIIFLAILVTLGSMIYRNTEEFTEYFARSKHTASCGKCGEINEAGTRFCSYCGEMMPEPNNCSNCMLPLKPGVKFCANCGTAAGESASQDNTNAEVSTCDSCGKVLKPGAKFCASCGATATSPAPEEQGEIDKAEEETAAATTAPGCIACKAEIKLGAKFCPNCGASQVI